MSGRRWCWWSCHADERANEDVQFVAMPRTFLLNSSFTIAIVRHVFVQYMDDCDAARLMIISKETPQLLPSQSVFYQTRDYSSDRRRTRQRRATVRADAHSVASTAQTLARSNVRTIVNNQLYIRRCLFCRALAAVCHDTHLRRSFLSVNHTRISSADAQATRARW